MGKNAFEAAAGFVEPGGSLAAGCGSVEEEAQRFVELLFERFHKSMVLLRLFVILPYALLPEEDRLFVERRGRDTGTWHLIGTGTPVFTLLGTRGRRPEWDDRRLSRHFRCIPLPSTAFVASLSMLSRQFESVGLHPELIDVWETEVAAKGSADRFRGILHIADAGSDRDGRGRMIVPKQEFVAENGVKSVFGFGSGYRRSPSPVTLFAFASERLEHSAGESLAPLLDGWVGKTEEAFGAGRIFRERR